MNIPNTKQKEDLLKAANKMRIEKGLLIFLYDSRLEASAQLHADGLADGSQSPHQNLAQRIEDSGFPISNDCLISRKAMQANFSEGIVNTSQGIDSDALDGLVSGGPNEAHNQDFYDPKITRVGIGISSGQRWNNLVLNYGIDCVTPISPSDF